MLNRLSAWFWTKPKTMETDVVKLPLDLPNWSLVKELLQDLQTKLTRENISEQETGWFMQTIYITIQSDRPVTGVRESQLDKLRLHILSNFKKKLDSSSLWFGMLKYLRKIPSDERDKFLYLTLPNIIEFALRIEDYRPKEPLCISRQQHGGCTKLSRQFVCSIVACFFLSLFPERKKDTSKMNMVNFTTFFKHLPQPAQIAKLRCVLHYFECVIERRMELHGNILFSRKVATPNWMLEFDELVDCDLKLCPLYIQSQGTIEDSGAGTIQVCFGNKSVGGGVLGHSIVQEEIRFSICPELMAAMLFMENMERNEAILVSGFEQFSSYTGYGDSLQFAGHYNGPDQAHMMVTIDAASYREISVDKQYEEVSVLRDLNKAVIGFSWVPGTDGGTLQPWEVVTGEDNSPVAVDVAADIVANAMTDALRQAAESPVDPDPHQPTHQSCHPDSFLAEPDHLSCFHGHQNQALHPSDNFNVIYSTSSTASESLHLEQNTSDSALPYSGLLQTLLPKYESSSSSSIPSLSVNVSSNSSLVLQPSTFTHSMTESPATVSCYSAQTFSQSSNIQQCELLEQPKKRHQLTTHLSVAEQPSSSASSTSDRNYPVSGGHLQAGLHSKAVIKDVRSSGLATTFSGRKLASDVLGNLPRTDMSSVSTSSLEISFDGKCEDCNVLQSTGSCELLEHNSQIAAVVKDLHASSPTSATISSQLPVKVDIKETNYDELVLPQNIEIVTESKCEDILNSIDVVLSLPALQSEFERVSSGLSNSSMIVSVGSQSLSANSAEDESMKRPTAEVLYINVDNSGLPLGTWRYSKDKVISDPGASSLDSMLLEPPLSSSPQSSMSSANVSPNTSFLAPESVYLEPPNGLSDVHVSADFMDGLNNQPLQSSRRGSRDFYGELRDFLNSSSSGSRGSGSGGPLSSTNSSWGSRSGSISSHGTNGSTIDFMEFWSHFRRRSSQLSDTMSRRSSSSKHSSDFSTDLEEISEGVPKHNHGVIEEEGSLMSLVADFASHFVSMVVRDGMAKGAHLTAGQHDTEADKINRSLGEESKLDIDICDQLPTDELMMDSVDVKMVSHRVTTGTTDRSYFTPSHQQINVEPDMATLPSDKELSLASLAQHDPLDRKISSDQNPLSVQPGYSPIVTSPLMVQPGYSPIVTSSGLSPKTTDSKCKSVSGTSIGSALSSSGIARFHEASTSLRGHQLADQRSSSHSLDSGFYSAMSSINLSSQPATVEFVNEETIIPSSVNTSLRILDDSCTLTTEVASHQTLAETVSAERLELKNEACESAPVNQSIPFSQIHDNTLYATLESKTIYFDNIPRSICALETEKQTEHPESASAETNAAVIPLDFVQNQIAGSSEIVEPVVSNLAAKNEPNLSKASYARAAKVLEQGFKYLRRQKVDDEDSFHLETQPLQTNYIDSETSRATQANTAASNGSIHVVHHSLSDTIVPSTKSSLIPKLKDSVKRLSGYSESLVPSISKSKTPQKHSSLAVRDRHKSVEERHPRDIVSLSNTQKPSSLSVRHKSVEERHPQDALSCRKAEQIVFKPHRSRYVFSDVAAPAGDKRRKLKISQPEAVIRKQTEKRTLKKQDERKRKQKGDSSRKDSLSFTRSPKFIRFVSSIAEMSLSEAVLEGAEILSSRDREVISDELYNWFATKIVTEVFCYVINELDLLLGGQQSHCQEAVNVNDSCASESSQKHMVSKREKDTAEAAAPKPKSILPTKPDMSGSKRSGQLRPSGSLKVVKFKDSRGAENRSLKLSNLQADLTVSSCSKTNVTPTFHRHSSTIPVAIRRRNSLDLTSSLSSTPLVHVASLSSSKSPLKVRPIQQSQSYPDRHPSLTSADLSIDIYQAAAAVVDQVLQAVSDSFDTQTLSPVSSCQHDTASSSDTAAHSTGSKIHSNYNSIASNIFSSSSVHVSQTPRRAVRPLSPSIGIFSRKPMSRETLTNAFLKVDSTPSIKSYERRSSEPCQTSVQLSLDAFNSIKFSQQAVEDNHRHISRTDDDIGRGRTWRRGSLDGFSFERRNSCGFKDPVLSRFAEELMKADTSVPELVIVGSHASSSSAGSRRSSICAYKETTLANLEVDLLNASFTSVCSLPMSHSSHSQCRRQNMDRSHSRESRNWKSDSSDTEYWFPPPKIVGDEFQQEYNRQHSQEELQDCASFFAGRVVQEAVCVLRCDPTYLSREEQGVELFAENLMDQIMRDALMATRYDNRPHDHLLYGHKDSGNSSQNQTSKSVLGSSANSDSGKAEHKVYCAEGARPKTSVTSAWTRSNSKSIPQRKSGHQLDCQTTHNSNISRNIGGHKDRKASNVGGHERLQSQSQKSTFASSKQSVQKNTFDQKPSSSKLKKHPKVGSFLPSSALLPTLSHSEKNSLTFPHSATSHHHPQEKHSRSKLDSASIAASGIPMYKGSSLEPFQLKVLPRTQREESCASSTSSVSSYHSEPAESPVSSSSGSESKEAAEKDAPSRKQRARREMESRSKVAYKINSTRHKERLRRRDYCARTVDVHSKRRSQKDGASHSESGIGQYPLIDQFAASLSLAVVDSALLCCKDNRWLRFLSYNKPIATGNWGCGALRGNAQLKLVIQWIAASVGQAPSVMYYTFNDRRLMQAQEIAKLISGQTVGHLAAALRDYCNWVRLYLASLSTSLFSSSTRSPQRSSQQTRLSYSAWKDDHDSQLPQTLFEFLLEKFKYNDTDNI